MKRTMLAVLAVTTACTAREFEATETTAPAVAGALQAADPALAIDAGTGDLLMAWVAGDSTAYHLYHARSSDDGGSWSAPVRVTPQPGDVRPHAEASPRLVAKSGVIALFWPTSVEVPGRRFPASHMRFSRSTDGGHTWSPPRILNDDTTSVLAGHTFHGATALGDSTLIVAWLDSRPTAKAAGHADPATPHSGDATVYTTRSDDLGATWAESNTPLWGDACPCCRVSLAGTPEGGVIASWRGHFDGSVRDPVVARLTETPAQPQRVHEDGWVFPGCPHSGPALAVDANGTTHVAWFTGKEAGAGVYYARSSGGAFEAPVPLLTGTTLQTGHPAMALLPDGGAVIAVNLDESGGRVLTLFRVATDGKMVTRTVVPNSESADHPQVISDPDGTIFVAWTDRSAGSRVRVVRIAGS